MKLPCARHHTLHTHLTSSLITEEAAPRGPHFTPKEAEDDQGKEPAQGPQPGHENLI